MKRNQRVGLKELRVNGGAARAPALSTPLLARERIGPMSMLVFFPWLSFRETRDFGSFELVRYVRGDRPGGDMQAIADTLLGSYYTLADDRVDRATLVRLTGHGLADDLNEAEQADVFEYAELLAFSALAARDYFRSGHYVNRDAFAVVIQRYAGAPEGTAIRSRRRDGWAHDFLMLEDFVSNRPHHVQGGEAPELDGPLCEALLKARETPAWEPLEEAIFYFNRANTDSDQVFPAAEALFMVSAFERALGVGHGTEDALADAFAAAWRCSRPHVPPPGCRIPPEATQSRSIAEAWIRDFYRHRSAAGHGRKETPHRKIWELREHLLLGAHAFPLLAKLVLARDALYTLTDEDQDAIDVFELLVASRPFEKRGQGRNAIFEWQRVRQEHRSERLRARVEERFRQMPREASDPPEL